MSYYSLKDVVDICHDIKADFEKLEEYQISSTISSQKSRLLKAMKQLENLPNCCRNPASFNTLQIFNKFVLSVPFQLDEVLRDIVGCFENGDEDDPSDSNYRADDSDYTDDEVKVFDITKPENTIVCGLQFENEQVVIACREDYEIEDNVTGNSWFDSKEVEDEIEGAMAENSNADSEDMKDEPEDENDVYVVDKRFAAKLQDSQAQLEVIQARLEELEIKCRMTKADVREEDVRDEHSKSEDENDESGDEDGESEDEDHESGDEDHESGYEDHGSEDARENDDLQLEAEDLQLDLQREIQNLGCDEPREANVSEGGDLNHLENKLERSSLQSKRERNGGTELEEMIEERIQLFLQACSILLSNGVMYLCRKHPPWEKKEPKPSSLKRRRRQETDSCDEESNRPKRLRRRSGLIASSVTSGR